MSLWKMSIDSFMTIPCERLPFCVVDVYDFANVYFICVGKQECMHPSVWPTALLNLNAICPKENWSIFPMRNDFCTFEPLNNQHQKIQDDCYVNNDIKWWSSSILKSQFRPSRFWSKKFSHVQHVSLFFMRFIFLCLWAKTW